MIPTDCNRCLLAFAIATMFATPALAQTLPDAGQLLQEQREAPTLPTPSLDFNIEAPLPTETPAGGAQVVVKQIRLTGHSVFDEATLQIVLGDVTGNAFDLAGLRALANRITLYYRNNGYPFARAFLPAQTAGDGVIRIEILEGRYGKVSTYGDDDVTAARANTFLAPLVPGEVISSHQLERTTLILVDQPGITIFPVMRPGEALGSGDLDVRVVQTPGISGDIAFDNHGSRYTGAHRVRANVQWDNPFSFADQLIARALHSDEDLWLGSLSYSLPLGFNGLRGNIGYAHNAYELGKEFAASDAKGTAKVSSLGINYPVIRSQRANLTLAATYQHKSLKDKRGLSRINDSKSSDSLPLTFRFDRRDGLWGGGISYGSLTYTLGHLTLDYALEDGDRISGLNTRGSFDKWNLDVARVQATPLPKLTLFGRISSQWAGKNLDSSEGFGLGGPNGVRAYPNGEGFGDEGWLVQLEVRYTAGAFSPYLFHDTGRVKINAQLGSLALLPVNNHRSLRGEGVGVRYNRDAWILDASVAWRSHGGAPESDTKDRNPRFWMSLAHRF